MISPLEELTIGEFLGYSEYYDIKYKIIESKGLINYKFKTIYINPLFNEDGLTLTHELLHHYYDNELLIESTESIVESMTMNIYKPNYEFIDYYVKRILK